MASLVLSSGRFRQVTDLEALTEVMESYLAEYNMVSKTPMNLVMFKFIIEHISRISRVLKQDSGEEGGGVAGAGGGGGGLGLDQGCVVCSFHATICVFIMPHVSVSMIVSYSLYISPCLSCWPRPVHPMFHSHYPCLYIFSIYVLFLSQLIYLPVVPALYPSLYAISTYRIIITQPL